MIKIRREEALISALTDVFKKTNSKFCAKDRMPSLLMEEGLTREEADESISLSLRRKLIRPCYTSPTRKGKSTPCYELLTDEDKEFFEELHQEFLKRHSP
jgi:hypothetical protein